MYLSFSDESAATTPGYYLSLLKSYAVPIHAHDAGRWTGPALMSTQSDLREIQIPLPPLEVQKEIVAEIEGYQKVINGARAVLDHYRPHIPIHPDWPVAATR